MFDGARLNRLVRGERRDHHTPAVVLATWPAGGRAALTETLETLDGVRVVSSADGLDAAPEPTDRDLPMVSVWVSEGRPDLGLVPARVIPGDVLRLDRSEMQAAAISAGRPSAGRPSAGRPSAGRSASAIEPWATVSEGWYGPFRRLLAEDDPEAAVTSAAFRQWVEAEILGRLPPEAAVVLDEIASVHDLDESIDVELWRRHFLDQPQRLAAFEALRQRWGLLMPAPTGLRLPKVLIASRRSTAQVAVSIRRSLAAAAAALERPSDAGALLRSAGDVGAARALEQLAGQRTLAGAIDLRLLGPPAIVRVGADGVGRELDWRSRRAFHLVAYLALAPGRRATRDDLVAHLFADASPASVKRNFHPTVSDARRTLGLGDSARGGILNRDGIYRLDPVVRWGVDRDRFEQAIERSEASVEGLARLGAGNGDRESSAELRTARSVALDTAMDAWRLYPGPLLDGYEAPWIVAERRRLHHRYVDALRRVARLASAADRPTLALDAWRSLLIQEPFEETAHVAVMELYAGQGRRDLVRRQFVRLQDLLKELRIGPADETVARYHALMR